LWEDFSGEDPVRAAAENQDLVRPRTEGVVYDETCAVASYLLGPSVRRGDNATSVFIGGCVQPPLFGPSAAVSPVRLSCVFGGFVMFDPKRPVHLLDPGELPPRHLTAHTSPHAPRCRHLPSATSLPRPRRAVHPGRFADFRVEARPLPPTALGAHAPRLGGTCPCAGLRRITRRPSGPSAKVMVRCVNMCRTAPHRSSPHLTARQPHLTASIRRRRSSLRARIICSCSRYASSATHRRTSKKQLP
jgi:hypothetical protein